MSFASDLWNYLKDDAGVAAIATGGVYRVRRKQGTGYPCLVITRNAVERGHDLSGGAGYSRPTVDFDCYAMTPEAADSLANAVRTALQGFSGTIGATEIMACLMGDEAQLYEQPIESSDAGVFHTAIDAEILYRESIPTFE